jgi:hypothetical protein
VSGNMSAMRVIRPRDWTTARSVGSESVRLAHYRCCVVVPVHLLRRAPPMMGS